MTHENHDGCMHPEYCLCSVTPSSDGSLKPLDSLPFAPAAADAVLTPLSPPLASAAIGTPAAKGTPSSWSALTATANTPGSPPSTASPAAYGRIYPPTQVESWLYCPMYRHLSRTWQPERVEWDPARLLGTAVGAGLSEHWRCVRGGTAVDTPEYWAGVAEAAYAPLRAEFMEGGDLTLAGAEKLVSRGLQEALRVNLEVGTQVLRVDESIGVSKPDLILRIATGLQVWDVKTARSLEQRYLQDRLAGYDTLWQLFHGAWEAQEFYGEPVVTAGILLVILSPKPHAMIHPVPMDPLHLQQWHQSAELVWRDMAAEEAGVRNVLQRFTSCERRRYGRSRCEFWAGCHTCYLDEEKMSRIYERKATNER